MHRNVQENARPKLWRVALYFLLTLTNNTHNSFADFVVLRDAEIESYLEDLIAPVLIMSDLPAQSIQVNLIQDDSINAFATVGSRIFVHTGLIQSANSYAGLQGVLAHEVGHIAKNHIARISSEIKRQQISSMIYSTLGAGAVLAAAATSGNARGAGALAVGSVLLQKNIMERAVLYFSRNMEREADSHAVEFFKKSHTSYRGMTDAFEKILKLQGKSPSMSSIYVMSHPLAQSRIDFIKSQFTESSNDYFVQSQELEDRFYLVQAKISGYLNNQRDLYSKDFQSNSEARLYEKAYRSISSHDYKKAESRLQKLINLNLGNPHYHEAIAGLYASTRQGELAEKHYKEAMRLSQDNHVIGLEYAIFLSNYKKQYTRAIDILLYCLDTDPDDPFVIQSLIYAYSESGKPYYAKLYSVPNMLLSANISGASALLEKIEESIESGELRGREDVAFFKIKAQIYRDKISTIKRQKK